MNQHAAVHIQRDAGAVLGQRAGKEHDAASHVRGLADAVQRDLVQDPLHAVFGDQALVDVGGDEPRRDAVDADAVDAHLACHRAGQTQHAGLRGRVMRPAENAPAALRGHRGDAHDRAGAGRAHRRQHGLRHVEGAAQADVEHRVVVGGRDVAHLARLRDAGVVHEDVDAAALLECGLGGALARSPVGHVGHEAQVLGPQTRGGAGGVGALQVEDHHARALRGHHAGRGEAQSVEAGTAGYEGHFVCEKHGLAPVRGCVGEVTGRLSRASP